MSKIDVVRSAMVEAMKNKDKARKDALSSALKRFKERGDRQTFPTDRG